MSASLTTFVPQGTIQDSALLERVALTQKEVRHVHQTSQSVAELLLRRLSSIGGDDQGRSIAAAQVISVSNVNQLAMLSEHHNLVIHALCGQLSAFSGGALNHPYLLRPLWLSLLLEGNGLRRMAADTVHYAKRLMGLAGLSPETLGEECISDPWTAYRLGLFPLAEKLNTSLATPSEDLTLRIRLATSLFDRNTIAEIDRIAPKGSTSRMTLLSSAVAYGMKQKAEVSSVWIEELKDWVFSQNANEISSDKAPALAQAINSMNLYLLGTGQVEEIESNMSYLLTEVTPRILSSDRRAHIEGNAFYQRSILARRRGDRDEEISALLRAMSADAHFSTLYYRTAQIFHDLGDTRAGDFYQLAIALSPLDHPTANDYGYWLMETGQTEKFESWVTVCRTLFPEHFSESEKAV